MLRKPANLHRQFSSRESDSLRQEGLGDSHSGGHHKNSSELSAKSLVDTGTRKWSISSRYHLLSGHGRNASNSRESLTDNGHFQADYQSTRRMPDSYRGGNAYTLNVVHCRQPRARELDKVFNDTNSVGQMGFSSLEREKSSSLFKRFTTEYKCSTPQKVAV